ncbi:MAG: molybdopterin-dependent oxidoreductase [Anaerolineae bacterium]
MINDLSGRSFLQLGAVAAGTLAVGQFIPPQVAQAAMDAGMLNARATATSAACARCASGAATIAKVRDGRVVKLDGNPEHPHSRGHLCVRGQSGLMNTYDPDRVLSPLIRVGKRGEGKFRKASWDEALDLTASHMLAIKNKIRSGSDGLFLDP